MTIPQLTTMPGTEAVPIPRWIAAIVALGALLTAGGAVLALVHPTLLTGSGTTMNAAAKVYAGYLVSRGFALALMLTAALILGARRPLAILMLLAACNQAFDALIDLGSGRVMLLPILIVFGALFLLGAAGLSGRPVWKPSGWRGRVPPR